MQKVIKRGCWCWWLNKQDRAVSFNFYTLNLVHFMFTLRIFHSFGTNSAQVNNWNYPQNDAKREKNPEAPEESREPPHPQQKLLWEEFLSSPQFPREHTQKTQSTLNTANSSLHSPPYSSRNLHPGTSAMAWRGLGEQQQLNAWPKVTGLLGMTKQQKWFFRWILKVSYFCRHLQLITWPSENPLNYIFNLFLINK